MTNTKNNLKITDFETNHKYFNLLKDVFSFASETFSKEGSSIITLYLDRVKKTIDALHLKHYYIGLNQSAFPLSISADQSGLPLKGEIKILEGDLVDIEDKIKNFGSIQSIREQIIASTLKNKVCPLGLQKKLSDRLYLEKIKDHDFFGTKSEPGFEILDKKPEDEDSQVRVLFHWSFYCGESNQPVLYLMEALVDLERDDKTITSISSETKSVLTDALIGREKLLIVGKRIDDELEYIHPKKITRIHLGTVYCSGVTNHGDELENILGSLSDGEGNWLYTWGVEHLVSKGTESFKESILASRRKREKFYIPHGDQETAERGCSEFYSSMIIPYQAYQMLVDHGGDILRGTEKYIIDNKKTMVNL